MDRVRVLRVIEYEGPREWVEHTVSQSIHGEKRFKPTSNSGMVVIRAATIGTYPEFLYEEASDGRCDCEGK